MNARPEVSRSEHHALTITGGPYGPLGGTHVFPRSDGLWSYPIPLYRDDFSSRPIGTASSGIVIFEEAVDGGL